MRGVCYRRSLQAACIGVIIAIAVAACGGSSPRKQPPVGRFTVHAVRVAFARHHLPLDLLGRRRFGGQQVIALVARTPIFTTKQGILTVHPRTIYVLVFATSAEARAEIAQPGTMNFLRAEAGSSYRAANVVGLFIRGANRVTVSAAEAALRGLAQRN